MMGVTRFIGTQILVTAAVCFGFIITGAAQQPDTFGFWAWQAAGLLVSALSFAALIFRDLRHERKAKAKPMSRERPFPHAFICASCCQPIYEEATREGGRFVHADRCPSREDNEAIGFRVAVKRHQEELLAASHPAILWNEMYLEREW